MFARSTNRINRFTKLLKLARCYITSHIIKNQPYEFRSQEEAIAIDSVGTDYGAGIHAERYWECQAGVTVAQKNILGEVLRMVPATEIKGLSVTAAAVLCERLKNDEDFLYELKNQVLYIAHKTKELDYMDPHITKDGKWRYFVSWDGYPFHLPATADDSRRFDQIYADMHRSFTAKHDFKVPDLHLQDILSDAWHLYKYIDDNAEYTDGYEEFRSKQIF